MSEDEQVRVKDRSSGFNPLCSRQLYGLQTFCPSPYCSYEQVLYGSGKPQMPKLCVHDTNDLLPCSAKKENNRPIQVMVNYEVNKNGILEELLTMITCF